MANGIQRVSGESQRPTVLVVDDNDALRSVVQRALEAANFHVISANCVRHALSILDTQPITAILTDFSMPDMDGLEFCRLARRRRPEVVLGIMTGWGVPADEAVLAETGIRFVLPKPFNLRELQALMVEALRN